MHGSSFQGAKHCVPLLLVGLWVRGAAQTVSKAEGLRLDKSL